MEQDSWSLANRATGENLYFGHADQFSTSDSEDTVVQETMRNTDTNKRPHPSIGSTQSTTRGDELEAFEEAKILPNGNWECRHKCGDKTKLGHPPIMSERR